MALTKVTYSMINGISVNVLDYGADPTGVANSSVAINAAITAASAKGIEGVYLPAGTYRCTSTITMLSNVTLFGEGKLSALHFIPTGTGQTPGITVANKSYFGIRDLRIYGDTTASTDLTWAIRIYGSDNGSVTGCFIDTAYLGVFVGDVSTTQSSNIHIENNTIRNIGLNGIAVNTFGSKIFIRGNTISESGTLASLANIGSGIEFRGATDSIISANNLYSLQYGVTGSCDGIRLEYVTEAPTQAVRNVSVVNNVIAGYSGFGVRGQFIKSCTITGNTFYSTNAAHDAGVLLLSNNATAASNYNVVAGNAFFVTGVVSGAAAIKLQGDTVQKTAFNTVTGNTVAGYRLGVNVTNSENNTICGNVLSNSSAQGIYHVSGSYNLISANKVCNSAASGIEVVAGTGITISGNESNSNSTYGIFLGASASACNVLWNTTVNNTTANYVNNGGTAVSTSFGTGSPESAVTASIGSQFLRTNGGANTTLYIKESGTGSTGWVAK